MEETTKPPRWFWLVAGMLVLWGLVGVVGFHLDLATSAADRAKLDPYDQQLYATRPSWFLACYGLAVWTGLIGSVLLMARKRFAMLLYVASLIAVVVMFGWMLVATNIVAHKGVLAAAGLPLLIAVICVFEIWLAGFASTREWIK